MTAWWTWVCAAALAAPSGWRGDGTGTFPDARPPTSWADGAHVAWTAALPGPSNASPVRGGDVVCVLAEPSTVLCVDATTGAVRWQADNTVIDALPAEQASRLRERVDGLAAKRQAYRDLQHAYSQVRRRARAGEDVRAELEAITTKMSALLKGIQALDKYAPEHTDARIGWTTPTPVTDGERIFAMFGTGVVSAYRLDGTRLWSRWLGERTHELVAHDSPPTSSPALAGDVLVVGYNQVLGLDAATGATRWTAGPHRDQSGFAVADVGGTDVVVTPTGRVLRASDGHELAADLGYAYFVTPVVQDDLLLFAGSTYYGEVGEPWKAEAAAWQLGHDGDTVTVAPRWRRPIEAHDRFYASPLVDGDRILMLGPDHTAIVLSATTGETLLTRKLDAPTEEEFWTSPAATDGSWWVRQVDGHVLRLDPATLEVLDAMQLEEGVSGLLFDGPWVYLRGRTRLYGIRAP